MTLDAARERKRQRELERRTARAETLVDWLRGSGNRPLTCREAMAICGCHTHGQLMRACERAGLLTGVGGIRIAPNELEGA